MKIGDRIPVQIEGMDVAEAVIEDIEDGNATLTIPATRLVVQVRQNLDFAATRNPEVDRVFGGLETPGTEESAASADLVEEKPAPAPVQEYNAPGSDVGEGIHGMKSFPGEMD